MLLGLSKIIDSPGASVTFSTTVDLSDLCYGVSYPVSEPVAAEGTVRNTAGVLVMTGEISTCIHGTCDRCARDFSREVRFPIDVVLVTELADEENEDEWVFPLEGDSADLDDIVRTVFVLSLDSKLLCKLIWQVRSRVGHQFDTLHTIFLLFRQQKAGHLLSQNLVWLLILYKRDGYKQNSLNYR